MTDAHTQRYGSRTATPRLSDKPRTVKDKAQELGWRISGTADGWWASKDGREAFVSHWGNAVTYEAGNGGVYVRGDHDHSRLLDFLSGTRCICHQPGCFGVERIEPDCPIHLGEGGAYDY